MNVWIKKFDVAMRVKNKGIELDICDTEGNHIGDLVVTKAKLVWCRGKTTPKKGKKVKWKDFIAYMERPAA